MNDICVKVENLSKRFYVLKRERTLLRTLKALIKRESLKRELLALNNVSFELKKGNKLAIIGKNGSGKTTLLRILSGIYNKNSGNLALGSEPKAIFKLSTGLNARLSVIDNIYLLGAIYQIPKKTLKNKMHKILEIAELDRLKFSLVKKLSAGQQQRLVLSVFFQAEGDFFIFDETVAFVDSSFSHKCERYFKKIFSPETTIIIASHDTSLLKKYCDTAIWLDEGQIRMHGEVEEIIDEYEKMSNA